MSAADNSSAGYDIEVDAGTLKAGNTAGFASLLAGVAGSPNPDVVIARGATLDLNGTNAAFAQLYFQGGGTLTNSGAADTVELSLFSDCKITGAIALVIGGTSGVVQLFADNTFTGGTEITDNSTLDLGEGGGTQGSVKGTISIDSGAAVEFDHTGNIQIRNFLIGGGNVTFSGNFEIPTTYILNESNSYTGVTTVKDATLSTDRLASIGAGGALVLNEGGFLATKSMTLNHDIDTSSFGSGSSALAAAHGKILTVGDNVFTVGGNLTFGIHGDDGTVVIDDTSNLTITDSTKTLDVRAGTLTSGGTGAVLSELTSGLATTTVESGATLDLAGHLIAINELEGLGIVKNSGATASLTTSGTFGGTFGGAIKGAIALFDNGSMTLVGTNTYAFGTTIDANCVMVLGNGGTTGSVTGDISVGGHAVLAFNRSDTMTIGGTISGTGDVRQLGSGTTVLNHANTYQGGTFIAGGTIEADNASALGTGTLTIAGGALVGGITESITNTLRVDGDAAFAATHGKVVTLDPTGGWALQNVHNIVFGSAADDGTVVWDTPSGGSLSIGYDVTIAGGTLKAGTGDFAKLFDFAGGTDIVSGATLDAIGTSLLTLTHLTGGGTIENSGGAVTLQLTDGNFSGTIGSHITVVFGGTTTLSGVGNFKLATIDTSVTLHLTNVAHENVSFVNHGGELILDDPAQFSGTVSGFIQTDKIDLTTVDFSGASFAFNTHTDILTVHNGAESASIHFHNGYRAANFALSDDGDGHVFVTTSLTSAPGASGHHHHHLDAFIEMN